MSKEKSEKVILVLIGGRSAVPAMTGILQFIDEIDRVKFLLCQSQSQQYLQFQENIKQVLKQERKKLFCNSNDIEIVDPNNFDEVYTAVEKLCSEVKELKYVNLTSVPQTMAISVYSYIRDNYEDTLVFTVNTDQAQIIPLAFKQPTIPFRKKLSGENYIVLCGLKIFNKKSNNSLNLIASSRYFVNNFELSNQLISKIRSKAGGGDSIKAPRGFTFNHQELEKSGILICEVNKFFEKLQEFSLIQEYKNSNAKISFQIKSQENYAFLSGDWLEIFIYNSAKDCNFDSVDMGIELSNYTGEIDLFCLNSANAMICECKTGQFKSDDLSKLDSIAEKLGGNYCVKLFVTNQCEVSEEFKNQAKNKKIVVVSGLELINITDILKKEMQTPTYQRR